MSLIDRALASKKGMTDASMMREEALEEKLKEGVQDFLTSSEMAEMIKRNPLQARNEIRLASERVIKERPWLAGQGVNRDELIERYLDSVFGFGPLEHLLADESVTEIMVNGCRSLYYERAGKLHPTQNAFSDEGQVYALIDKIVSPLGRRVDESSPMVNARLPKGHRVNVIIPPLAMDGPVVTIRKFRDKVFPLDELREIGSFNPPMQVFMEWAVQSRKNIAVSGGTGSGKTTLLNALSMVISSEERIVTIEDSAELRFDNHPHVVRLEARPKNAEGVGEVTIRDLVINALRMRPDRIVVGECRGAEALDMLQAMTTGHDGSLTTLHANSPKEAVSRLTTMVRYGADLPVEVIEGQIASAIDLVFQTVRGPDGKRYVSAVVGYSFSPETRRCTIETYFRFDELTHQGSWLCCPPWIDELAKRKIAREGEVASWKRSVCLPA